MDDHEDRSLLSGFRCHPLSELHEVCTTYEDCRYMEDVQMGNKILMGCEFEPWEEFDLLASNVANELHEAITRRGCHLDSEQAGLCRGTFQNRSCDNEACSKVGWYKSRMRALSDPQYHHMWINMKVFLLRGLQALAQELRANWSGTTGIGPLVNSQVVYPSLGFKESSLRERNVSPQIIIDLFTPNSASLLPQMKGRDSLASAYTHSCANIDESSVLSYDLRCMAQAVKCALFTKSGYGCLFNHNQAVFVKVYPTVVRTGAMTRVGHKVYVSREFKCDAQVSTFHGLLALAIHGNEASSNAMEKMLREYFRLLETSEASECGELVVPHSPGKNHKRRATERSRSFERGKEMHVRTARTRGVRRDNSRTSTCLYPDASKEAQQKIRDAIRGGKFAVLSELDMIRTFMPQSRFMEIGESGVLLETEVEDVKMVVKRWNRKTDYGLAWLLREILVYKKLAELEPEILGSVVPRLIAVSESTTKESVLVTEYVGSTPYLDRVVSENERDKEWYVDGEILSEEDKREIERCAVEGLRKLYRCGIIHQDARPGNLRVERIRERGDMVRWRTWWIDLGLVTVLDKNKFGDMAFMRSICEDDDDDDDESANYWNDYEPAFRFVKRL